MPRRTPERMGMGWPFSATICSVSTSRLCLISLGAPSRNLPSRVTWAIISTGWASAKGWRLVSRGSVEPLSWM